uniref:Transmembrane protein 82 n=1 Tax=Cyclopterus lumpus TaxID=8103 RepID=A0A8C3FZ18_CYCLU
CHLIRIYNLIETSSNLLRGNWITVLQFWFLTGLLSLVGSRVSSLIVLEHICISTLILTHFTHTLCQFSLGCGLTCTLDFLHQGAPHSSFCLFLAAALSWALASASHSVWSHVAKLYPLHSRERYCGKCITLLATGHTILASVQRAVVLAFALATVASTATVYDHFLSQKDALKFWTPLTLCYTMLVVYIQEDQQRQTGKKVLLHTVILRLGALLVLMLTVGNWSDVLHVLIAFLGEAVCLLPSQDLLKAALKVFH